MTNKKKFIGCGRNWYDKCSSCPQFNSNCNFCIHKGHSKSVCITKRKTTKPQSKTHRCSRFLRAKLFKLKQMMNHAQTIRILTKTRLLPSLSEPATEACHHLQRVNILLGHVPIKHLTQQPHW